MSTVLPDRGVALPPCTDIDLELTRAVDDGLLDQVIQRIYHAGLLLARADMADSVGVHEAIGELDAMLRDVTAAVFNWQSAHNGARP